MPITHLRVHPVSRVQQNDATLILGMSLDSCIAVGSGRRLRRFALRTRRLTYSDIHRMVGPARESNSCSRAYVAQASEQPCILSACEEKSLPRVAGPDAITALGGEGSMCADGIRRQEAQKELSRCSELRRVMRFLIQQAHLRLPHRPRQPPLPQRPPLPLLQPSPRQPPFRRQPSLRRQLSPWRPQRAAWPPPRP